jgi:hypothetical protein
MTTPIAASPAEVFDFVSDVYRYPEWDAFADEILAASDSPLVHGSTYRERSGKDESDWKVVEFERPRRQRHLGNVPFLGEVSVEMDLVPTEASTLFRHVIEYHVMPGPLRPLGWLIERLYVDRFARTRMERTHEGARRILENRDRG